jgi:hypothetical protein
VVLSYWPWPESRVTAKRGDGSVLPGWWPRPVPMAESAPVVTDVNGDGVDEAVAKMYYGTTILDTHSNEVPWWHPTSATSRYSDPAVADLDGDGRKEVITYGASYPSVIVQVWRWDGSRGGWTRGGSTARRCPGSRFRSATRTTGRRRPATRWSATWTATSGPTSWSSPRAPTSTALACSPTMRRHRGANPAAVREPWPPRRRRAWLGLRQCRQRRPQRRDHVAPLPRGRHRPPPRYRRLERC